MRDTCQCLVRGKYVVFVVVVVRVQFNLIGVPIQKGSQANLNIGFLALILISLFYVVSSFSESDVHNTWLSSDRK